MDQGEWAFSFRLVVVLRRRNIVRAKFILAVAVCCLLSATVSVAAPVMIVGSHDLVEDSTGQTISLYVTGTAQVTGFNLRAQIGDGTGSGDEPVFESVDFSGGMWDAYANTVTGGPVGGFEQFAQASVAFNDSVSISASGLLVTFSVDTTGFFDGDSFALKLESTEIGADSDFVAIGGSTVAPDILNGIINIGTAPVPEPATLSLLAIGGTVAIGLALSRRRKRSL